MNPVGIPVTGGLRGGQVNLAGALLDSIACGVIVVASSGQILTFDTGAERLTGLRASDVLGRPSTDLPGSFRSIIDETLASKGAVLCREVRTDVHGDPARLLSVSTEILQPCRGGDPSVLLKLQNVAQAQEMATNLEHLDRLANLGVLTAGVAHEIKNALVAVRTFVDLLREQHKEDDLSQLVSKEIGRIENVVRQVLRDATREQFKLAPLRVHALLQDAMNLLRHQFEARSIQAALRLDAAQDQIKGDERQLRHALLNLLMNSVEAMSGAGRLEVISSISAVNGRRDLCVKISDTGSGIHPDHLPLLFSPFFTTKNEGTGLGLAITHRIIQQHDGKITVESKVNEGTTFHVLLPLL
jgi:signal transduction histidine kinase